MAEMTSLQRLAIGQYLSKRLEAELKRGAGGLRDEVDEEMRSAYDEDGADRRAVVFGGVKVGSMSAALKPATEQKTGKRLAVTDYAAFAGWAATNQDVIADWLTNDADARDSLAGWALAAFGEQPNGTEWLEYVMEYGRPERFDTRLTINTAELEKALPELRAGVLGELMGDD